MTSFSKQINQDLLLDQQMSILSKSKSGKIPENNIALNPKLNQIVKLVLEVTLIYYHRTNSKLHFKRSSKFMKI